MKKTLLARIEEIFERVPPKEAPELWRRITELELDLKTAGFGPQNVSGLIYWAVLKQNIAANSTLRDILHVRLRELEQYARTICSKQETVN